MYTVLVQGIGFVAAGLLIASFQCKKANRTILLQGLCNAVYVVHYALLGAYTGALSQGFAATHNIIAGNRKEKQWAQWNGWYAVYVVIYLADMYFTWQGLFSVLPACAMIAGAFAAFSGRGQVIRLANLCIVSPCWLIYNIHSRSLPGTLCELFCITSIIVSFARYGRKID